MKWFGVMVMGLLLVGCSTYQYRATPSRTQSIDLYNADGSRKAYGHLDGSGYFQLFSPSGNRLGYGRVGK